MDLRNMLYLEFGQPCATIINTEKIQNWIHNNYGDTSNLSKNEINIFINQENNESIVKLNYYSLIISLFYDYLKICFDCKSCKFENFSDTIEDLRNYNNEIQKNINLFKEENIRFYNDPDEIDRIYHCLKQLSGTV